MQRALGGATRAAILAATLWLGAPASVVAQPANPEALAEQALAEPPPTAAPGDAAPPLLQLFVDSGWLMAPIALMSVIVVAVALERMLGLRRGRVLPRRLAEGLRQQANAERIDPETIYDLCRRYPSAAARVALAALAKGGRPHAEVEAAANDAAQTEADHMYGNVRTLNLAAAVTPLMGLLGTVWGMIESFFATANMQEGADKASVLAEGIYVALMTTFAGLAVAIPAAVLAHYFEGRILRSLRAVERMMSELLPRIEALEGRERVDFRQLDAAYKARLRGVRVDPPPPPAPSALPPHLARHTDARSNA